MKIDKTLNCVSLYCPMPVLKVREALDTMDAGDVLEVLADDPASEEDIPSLLKHLGHELIKKEKNGNILRFIINKRR